jgi:hypothetical protein
VEAFVGGCVLEGAVGGCGVGEGFVAAAAEVVGGCVEGFAVAGLAFDAEWFAGSCHRFASRRWEICAQTYSW